MSGYEVLEQHEDRWTTAMGAWFAGKRVVFRGHDLHTELNGMTWMELYLFGITGRRFTAVQLRVLNAMWTYTSYPEPRIWNNRVVALAGTARSTGALAVGAAISVSEASIYGRRPDIRAIDFLLRTLARLHEGADLDTLLRAELSRYRAIAGYGRPVTRRDERIAPMMQLLAECALDTGPHVRLALDVETRLQAGRWRLFMNIGALYAAVAADLRFTPHEYYQFMIPSFVAGMLPCFVDAAAQPEGAFFPLRCDRIAYEGTPPRRWSDE
jgi:hypothetical protein